MKSIGHPLFNDPEYGGEKILKDKILLPIDDLYKTALINPGQALHAKSLSFEHPTTKNKVLRIRFTGGI